MLDRRHVVVVKKLVISYRSVHAHIYLRALLSTRIVPLESVYTSYVRSQYSHSTPQIRLYFISQISRSLCSWIWSQLTWYLYRIFNYGFIWHSALHRLVESPIVHILQDMLYWYMYSVSVLSMETTLSRDGQLR